MEVNTKINAHLNSPEGNISPSTLRALTTFAGFATETYLGKN
jgi:hypothetical protein